jgi:hypothetical protein
MNHGLRLDRDTKVEEWRREKPSPVIQKFQTTETGKEKFCERGCKSRNDFKK